MIFASLKTKRGVVCVLFCFPLSSPFLTRLRVRTKQISLLQQEEGSGDFFLLPLLFTAHLFRLVDMVFGSLGLGTATAPPPPRGDDEEVPSPVSAASGRRLREDPLSLLLLDPRSEDILNSFTLEEPRRCTGQPENKAASFIKMNLFELPKRIVWLQYAIARSTLLP